MTTAGTSSDKKTLIALARQGANAAGLDAGQVAAALSAGDYFAVLELLIPQRPSLPANVVAELREPLEALLRIKAYSHPATLGETVPVVFGTGGHRGEIGRGLTLAHVHAITTALVQLIAEMAPAERERHFGAAELSVVQEKGIVIGHDNRLFNPSFSFYVGHLLEDAGFRVRYAGRVSSPELSRVVPLRGWAGSVNFTPSHNPFRYGGIKINPADGGLAGNDITDPLEEMANRNLDESAKEKWPAPGELESLIEAQAGRIERVDVHTPYLEALDAHPVVRLADLCRELGELPAEGSVRWVVDPVWGAAVPVYQRIQQRMGEGIMTLIHTEDDPYFGGQTTEPNPQTLSDALDVMRDDPARFKVAIRNDPDGDRGLVGDDGGAIKMNRYAALVMRYLYDMGQAGDLVTTIPTSHFGPDYARSRGSRVHLTPTGFKNFRPFLQGGGTMLAYEESDGLTIGGHSLDKDGVMAGLLALRIVLHYGRSLSDLLNDIEAELGPYYWEQKTFMIDIPAREAKQKLTRLADYRPGQEIGGAGHTRTIAEVNTDDGYKFTFDDGSWLMMRPSGTEPKLRIYAETRSSPEETRALCEMGEKLARDAIHAA
ncbi:MAG: hypothetical protein IID61_01420 [SAR324 cluster bacterium]|nr:hypothetical protein [SAR324 cluster bacterium]